MRGKGPDFADREGLKNAWKTDLYLCVRVCVVGGIGT